MLSQLLLDGRVQVQDTLEDSPPQLVLGQVAEEALHHVKPEGAGGSEVDVEPRMASQALLDLGVLVSRIVVRNQVDLLVLRGLPVQESEKLNPLLVAMPGPSTSTSARSRPPSPLHEAPGRLSPGAWRPWVRWAPSRAADFEPGVLLDAVLGPQDFVGG